MSSVFTSFFCEIKNFFSDFIICTLHEVDEYTVLYDKGGKQMSRYTFDNDDCSCYDDSQDACSDSGFYARNGANEQSSCSCCHKRRDCRCFREIPCPFEREERTCNRHDCGCKRACNRHDEEEDENQDYAKTSNCSRCRFGCILPCLFCSRRHWYAKNNLIHLHTANLI